MATKTSAADLIGKMAQKPKTSAKAATGKPEVNDPALDAQIDTFVEQKRNMETAKAMMDSAKAQILAECEPERLAACVRDRKVHASVAVNGRLTMTQMRRYSKIDQGATDELAEAFGDDFGDYFEATLAIALAPGSANDDAVLEELIEKLGPEFFEKHFEVRRDLVVKEAFHTAYCTDENVQKKAAPFVQSQVIKNAAASLKIK